MEFRTFEVGGLLEITPGKIVDERGYFSETFRQDRFSEQVGAVEFVQENQSLSVRMGTVRGIHFQSPPAVQGKLVRCLAGAVFDVAVDLRTGSPTFGRWAAVTLTPEAGNQFWVPAGFGHGFCTLQPQTVISYRVTGYYSREHDKGVIWNDESIAIDWPDAADPSTLSSKDREQLKLTDLPAYFQMEGA